VIGNDLIRYSFGLQGSAIAVRSIADPVTGREWHVNGTPDSSVVVNGQQITIGSSATTLVDSNVSDWWGGVKLDVVYRVASPPLRITRSYACYPGSAVIETWTNFFTDGGQSVTLSGLTNFTLSIRNGTVRWLKGLQIPDDAGGPFTLSKTDVGEGQTFQLDRTLARPRRMFPGPACWPTTSSLMTRLRGRLSFSARSCGAGPGALPRSATRAS